MSKKELKFCCYYNSLRVDDSIGAERNEKAWEGELPSAHEYQPLTAGETQEEVRQRFNAHFALPSTIDHYRGRQYQMPEGKFATEVLYSQGGGCGVYAMFDIRQQVKGAPVPSHEKLMEYVGR